MSSRVPSSASPPREAGPPTQYLRLLLGLLAGGIAGNVLTLGQTGGEKTRACRKEKRERERVDV